MKIRRRNFLKQLAGLGSLASVSVAPSMAVAGRSPKTHIENIRLSSKDDYTRFVFDLDGPAKHTLFLLHKPERLVIDFYDTRLSDLSLTTQISSSLLHRVRSGIQNGKDLRVVFDLRKTVVPRSFLLKPSGDLGHRVVLDLRDPAYATRTVTKSSNKLRDVIVAIDPGHGGIDPGAIGRNGTREKDISLQIGKKLEALINKQPGMRAVMSRKSDHSVRLRDRIKKARLNKADMMISLHADSYPDPRARGSSVYALSVSGASSETARLMAEKENASDQLFGGLSVGYKDEMVREVLLDLSLTGTIESSLDIGDEILKKLGRVTPVHKKKVQQAAFAVLKAPNIPSILLETAFISNPREEKKLRSASHQRKVSLAILHGINDYFVRKAPPGTWLSETSGKYKVSRGDTLGSVADQFNTSVKNLRARNALYTNSLDVGQVLVIPVS